MPYFIRRSAPHPPGDPPPIDPAWQAFIDVAPAMIWISEANGRLILVNAAWRAATGRDAAATTPGTAHELVHPDDRDKLGEGDTPAAGRPDAFEYRLRHA